MTDTTPTTVQDATPHWPAPARPKPGAQNVVLVLLDDCGFSQLGCYGASIRTPAIDRLAGNGLRYTNFHVTAMCSPTRSSLLTGRNHHAVGMGYLADFDTGFDNARGAISPKAATLAEMLREGGYATYALGKWHLAPPAECSPVGPFRNWPTQRGFDRWYGFLGGEDDQYAPELWSGQEFAPLPERDDYHLSEDLVERAQGFLADHVTTTPDRPFFLYLAFGACHAPHQAPPAFIEPYRGAFDAGWDAEREKVLARQKAMGIVPPETTLPDHNADVTPWAEVGEDARAVMCRMQEVFAGFTSHTDAQIGRLVAYLDRQGLGENTLFIVMSDNGASGEGGVYGSENEYRYFLGLPDTLEENRAAIDRLGGPHAHNHYPSGWAQAGNTPLKMYKKFTFGGGIRAPLILHWPAGIDGAGGLRAQFHHAIDIVPTVLEFAGVEAPAVHRGVEQLPLHGTSLAYSVADADAGAPSRRTTQYFEMGGQRGIYHDGWKAVTRHLSGTAFEDDVWELYHLADDYSEVRDLARKHPGQLRALVDLWWEEARRNGVLPLDDRAQARAFARDPATTARRDFAMRPFRVEARVAPLAGGEEGVLFAYGRRAAGFALYLKDGRLCFDYNLAGRHNVLRSRDPVARGLTRLAGTLALDGGHARFELSGDGAQLGASDLPMGFPAGFGLLSSQCGMNYPSPVSADYPAPFSFTGIIESVTVTLGEADEAAAAGLWEAALRKQ
ncbi:arylsulfatase [uncultured Amaricoccus sp.]|uniref:arylsulfatase n=1 Tax=uncultured Amaricoccus sp. TaxID=339341 RepID=UPI0026323CEF|nr:arylsulfatase [uncultured Amaricoccus sp.]